MENIFVPIRQAAIPITDLAVQRGIGLFESLRTYNKNPFALDQRLKRLFSSVHLLGLKLGRGTSAKSIERIVKLGLKKVRFGESLIKIILTGGDSGGLGIESQSRLYVIFSPLHLWPQVYYENGIKLKTVKSAREFTHLKSLSYLIPALADHEAKKFGFEEALFADEQNHLLEGTQFNFAIIKKQKIVTPKDDVLAGITMDIVLSLAKNMGLQVERRKISYRELHDCDEVFITSATREIIPVAKIDRIKIAGGKPGRITSVLLKEYRKNARNQNRKEKA